MQVMNGLVSAVMRWGQCRWVKGNGPNPFSNTQNGKGEIQIEVRRRVRGKRAEVNTLGASRRGGLQVYSGLFQQRGLFWAYSLGMF